MNPFRCSNCDKLLGLIEGKAEIKCPKCKTVNVTQELWDLAWRPGGRIPIDWKIGKQI